MSSARRSATLVLAVAIATGCTDTTKPAAAVNEPALAPQQTSSKYAEGPQSAPAGAGPEWTDATSISVEAAVGFRNDPVNPDENVPGNMRSYAWGQALVRYFANEADAKVDLTVRKSGTLVASAQGETQDRNWLPAYRSFSAITQTAVPAACGHNAQAVAYGSAWNKALIPPVGWFEWGKKADGATAGEYQPQCASGPPGQPGGGDQTPPPPTGSEPTNCSWVRDYVIYTDGSWEWSSPWYHSCNGDPLLLTPGGPTEIARSMSGGLSSISAAKAKGGPPMHLTLVGTSQARNGQVVTIERNAQKGVDATITVDVSRATAADLEEAFIVAEALSLKVKPKDARHAYGSIIAAPSASSRTAAGAGSRAAKNLDALLRSGARGKAAGDGARVDVVVNRKP